MLFAAHDTRGQRAPKAGHYWQNFSVRWPGDTVLPERGGRGIQHDGELFLWTAIGFYRSVKAVAVGSVSEEH